MNHVNKKRKSASDDPAYWTPLRSAVYYRQGDLSGLYNNKFAQDEQSVRRLAIQYDIDASNPDLPLSSQERDRIVARLTDLTSVMDLKLPDVIGFPFVYSDSSAALFSTWAARFGVVVPEELTSSAKAHYARNEMAKLLERDPWKQGSWKGNLDPYDGEIDVVLLRSQLAAFSDQSLPEAILDSDSEESLPAVDQVTPDLIPDLPPAQPRFSAPSMQAVIPEQDYRKAFPLVLRAPRPSLQPFVAARRNSSENGSTRRSWAPVSRNYEIERNRPKPQASLPVQTEDDDEPPALIPVAFESMPVICQPDVSGTSSATARVSRRSTFGRKPEEPSSLTPATLIQPAPQLPRRRSIAELPKPPGLPAKPTFPLPTQSTSTPRFPKEDLIKTVPYTSRPPWATKQRTKPSHEPILVEDVPLPPIETKPKSIDEIERKIQENDSVWVLAEPARFDETWDQRPSPPRKKAKICSPSKADHEVIEISD